MTDYRVNIKRLLNIIALDQTYIEFTFTVVIFVFFDPASRLLPADTSYATRSMWYGTSISIPYFVNLFFAPLLSSLSDEFGRRKFLLFEISSAFTYLLMAALAIYLGYLWLLLVSFVIRGAFSRTNTTALAMIGDACPKHNKMADMGRLQFAIGLGACLGPIIAGFFAKGFFFDTLNFSLPFFIAAGLALINTVLTYFLIEETLQQSSSSAFSAKQETSRLKANLLSIKHVMTHPDVLKTSLLLLLLQLSWSTYYQFISPLLKVTYEFDTHLLGIFIGVIAFWIMVGAGPVFKFMHNRLKLSPTRILNISAGLEIAGILIVIATYYQLLPNYFLWISAAPITIGDVLAYICIVSLYSNAVSDHMQGKVMGVNFLIVGLVWGSSGFLGGILIGYSPILPLFLAPLGAIASLFLINASFGRKMILNYSA